MAARRFTISGRVQGVFFRAETQEKANELGLTGWVQNNPDGSVEIHAEGPEDALACFATWCREGPSAAVVERVHEEEVPERGEQTFDIIR